MLVLYFNTNNEVICYILAKIFKHYNEKNKYTAFWFIYTNSL